MMMPGRTYSAVNGYRYGFNGKENDNDVMGEGNQQDYGRRIFDPRVGRFLSKDPISSKFPELTPYQFRSNTPIQAIDLDGLEAVNWVKSFGLTVEKPKLTQGHWYRIVNDLGLWRTVEIHSESFNSAVIYNSKNHHPEAYKTIEDRHRFYESAQDLITAKGIDSKWFAAAGIVTGRFAVGGAELDHFNWILGTDAKDFLLKGNEFLFNRNIQTFNQLYNNGKLEIDYKTSNGKPDQHTRVIISASGGKEMDEAMVMYEQLIVQDFITQYKQSNPEKDMSKIMSQINESFLGALASSEVKTVIKENFENKGRKFNFASYEDRVELGKELINNIRIKEKVKR